MLSSNCDDFDVFSLQGTGLVGLWPQWPLICDRQLLAGFSDGEAAGMLRHQHAWEEENNLPPSEIDLMTFS